MHTVSGTLLGGFTLSGVHHETPHLFTADIQTLSVSWKKKALAGEWTFQLNPAAMSDTWQGSLTAAGRFAGTPFQPLLTGKIYANNIRHEGLSFGNLTALIQLAPFHAGSLVQATLQGRRFPWPATGTVLSDIQLQAQIHATGNIRFQGTFSAGPGKGKLSGVFSPRKSDKQLSLTIQGENLQVADLPQWQVSVSPDMTLSLGAQRLSIQGHMLIPEAYIAASGIGGATTLPRETVMTGTGSFSSEDVSAVQTALQLELVLGQHIYIDTPNLTAHVRGSLHLSQLPGGPVTATGELMIPPENKSENKNEKNIFQAYGRSLSITAGKLILTGGWVGNPGLDITAIRTIRSVSPTESTSFFSSHTELQSAGLNSNTLTVGIHATGTLEKPVIQLFSDPALPQADKLSYLAFGFPRSQISGQQTAMLLSALSAFTPGTGGHFTQKLQDRLGISELKVDTMQYFNPATQSAVSTPVLVIGKQLAPRLSVHYSTGISTPMSIVNLRYQLNRHWALQSESSTFGNGADLLFGIEQD